MTILIAVAIWLAQQAPPAPRVAAVEGTVINTLTKKGIAGATVILRSTDADAGPNYAEETGADGHFRINDVAAGEYSITADRQNFFPQPDGAPGARFPRVKVSPGEQVTGVVLNLAPTGVITGRVLDPDGEPIRGAQVEAMQYAYASGQRHLRGVVQVQSSNKGEFRLFGLRPGSYRLQAIVRGMRPVWTEPQEIRGPRVSSGYTSTFFPSTVDPASAVPVELKAGAELSGFDITVRPSQGWHSVRAKYTGADDVGIQPMLLPQGRLARGYAQAMRSTGDTLEFTGVLPGSYVLLVVRTEAGVKTYARQQVEVSDADVDAGTLVFSHAVELRGAVKIEGTRTAAFDNLEVSIQDRGRSPFGGHSAAVKPDGSFVIDDIAPEIYQVVLKPPDGLYIKSLRLAAEELPALRLDLTRGDPGPLTLVLAADTGKIEGSVVLAGGNPAERVRVTLFPDGAHAERSDLFRFVFTDDKGKFHFDKAAPGEYRLFAWEDVPQGAPQDPEFRARFEKQSVRVKLAPKGEETVSLTVIVTKNDEPQ